MPELYKQQKTMFWRVVALCIFFACFSGFGLWIFIVKIIFRPQDIITMPVLIVVCSLTMLSSIFLIIRPKAFYMYAVFFCLWGLLLIANADAVFGLILVITGYGLAFKFKFLQKLSKVKKIICGTVLLLVMLTPLRYGSVVFVQVCMKYCGLLIVAGVAYLFFLPDLQRISHEQKEELKLVLPVGSFTADDVLMLQKVIDDEKYEAIAFDMNMSMRTLNRKIQKNFGKLGITNKSTFMARYARCTVVLGPNVANKQF